MTVHEYLDQLLKTAIEHKNEKHSTVYFKRYILAKDMYEENNYYTLEYIQTIVNKLYREI